jgi:hypothetical protein
MSSTGFREIKAEIIKSANMGGGWTNQPPACIEGTENAIAR